jgi:hypothetical protein
MRRFFAITALVLSAAAGCHMCASPYDYCGPVIENNGPQSYGPQMGGDYAATRPSYGPQSQSMAANSQANSPQGPSLGWNSTTTMR